MLKEVVHPDNLFFGGKEVFHNVGACGAPLPREVHRELASCDGGGFPLVCR